LGKIWCCNYCRVEYSALTISNAVKHLRLTHPDKYTDSGTQSSNQTTLEASIKPRIQAKILRKLLIEWIVDRRHAFKEVEAESFRNIIEYLDKAAISKLPHSANTICNDCLKYFAEAKLVITELLTTARSNIHLSFDLSTSPNCKALLAITAHWISSIYKARATLLAIKELDEAHTGENISEIVYDCHERQPQHYLSEPQRRLNPEALSCNSHYL
jgi:hypothetical protein